MADEVSKSFETLPIEQLICAPILAVAQGQSQLCRVYLDYLYELAFEKDGDGKSDKTRVIKFNLNRTIITPDGDVKVQPITVEAPLLSLVPVPSFTMDETTVRFTMEVKEVSTSKITSASDVSASSSFSLWGFKANVSGKVTTSSENTRSSDHSAKYEIYARAVQQQPTEGMAKLTQLFASVIEPIEAGGGSAS